MTHLPQRITGVIVLAVAVVLYDATSIAAVHRLVLPLAMALAAWLMVQNAAAVLLGVALLTPLHAHPADPDWISARAYPVLAIVSGTALAVIVLQRFRLRIESTREARWRNRRSNKGARHE